MCWEKYTTIEQVIRQYDKRPIRAYVLFAAGLIIGFII